MTRILVVGPSWVGDMVMAQSLFKGLKADDPGCTISVLAPAWSAPVTDRMPEVDDNMTMPVGHGKLELGARWRLARSLRGQFDQAIVLPGSLKSALIPWLARIPKRTGYTGEQRYGLLNDRRDLDKTRLPLHIQRAFALGRSADNAIPSREEIPVPALRVSTEMAQAAAAEFGLEKNRPILGLCPGAEFGPAKQWPAEHFAAVARHWLDTGGQVVVLGSPKDAEIAAAIVASASGTMDLTGKTSLGQAIDVMSLTDAVVSNDSGLMHIAAAVGTRVVALYGSSSPDYTPPLSDRASIQRLNLSCQPCFERTCPLNHLNCLKQLEPKRVVDALIQDD